MSNEQRRANQLDHTLQKLTEAILEGENQPAAMKADRIRAEKAIEIDQLPVPRRVEKIGAVALVEDNDDSKSIEQNMLGGLDRGRGTLALSWIFCSS